MSNFLQAVCVLAVPSAAVGVIFLMGTKFPQKDPNKVKS